MKFSRTSGFLTGFYVAMLLLWLTIQFLHSQSGQINLAFVFLYGFIPLLGGIFGIHQSEKWGLFKSAMGKALFFLSLGLITWSIGEMIWTLYYNLVMQVEIPYPSLADASFIISWPLWIIGIWNLSKATGAKYGLRKNTGRLLLIIVPILALLVSYYLLVDVARQGVVELSEEYVGIFFDLAYPILDVVILTIALMVYGLSFKYLGGRFKMPVVLILLSFVVNYFADFTFSYTTAVETYYNGAYPDILFATAMFLMSVGINSFDMSSDS